MYKVQFIYVKNRTTFFSDSVLFCKSHPEMNTLFGESKWNFSKPGLKAKSFFLSIYRMKEQKISPYSCILYLLHFYFYIIIMKQEDDRVHL